MTIKMATFVVAKVGDLLLILAARNVRFPFSMDGLLACNQSRVVISFFLSFGPLRKSRISLLCFFNWRKNFTMFGSLRRPVASNNNLRLRAFHQMQWRATRKSWPVRLMGWCRLAGRQFTIVESITTSTNSIIEMRNDDHDDSFGLRISISSTTFGVEVFYLAQRDRIANSSLRRCCSFKWQTIYLCTAWNPNSEQVLSLFLLL